MRNRFLYAAAVLAAMGAGPAAADLAVRPPLQQPIAPMPAYMPDWAGFYLGFHGGGGWDKADYTIDVAGAVNLPLTSATLSGGVFGGHTGYNWQYGPWVGGVEVDFSGADLRETSVTPARHCVPYNQS